MSLPLNLHIDAKLKLSAGPLSRSFGDFPMRISTVLSETYSRSHAFRTIIYPAYQTKGHLAEAVDSFAAWLIETYLTATHESNGNPLTATHEAEGNPVDIILLAHSFVIPSPCPLRRN